MEFKLFKPIQLGDITLQHRIVLAPCTRLRNSPEGAPLDITVQYYEQRATVPGTFLISEGQCPFFFLACSSLDRRESDYVEFP